MSAAAAIYAHFEPCFDYEAFLRSINEETERELKGSAPVSLPLPRFRCCFYVLISEYAVALVCGLDIVATH